MVVVVVRKSSLEVVRPAAEPEPVTTTTQDVNLSPYDKNAAAMQVTMFLVFDRPIHKPAETIKGALSRALAHYLPVSGRVAAADDDQLRITKMGEGVSFVAAAASCALKDVNFFDDDESSSSATGQLVDQLAIYYQADFCGQSDPLLMMQVTEFSCGGFVVGVTWNHGLADAAGIGQFMQAVGELARGLPSPSVLPVRWDDLLSGGPPPIGDGFIRLMKSLQPVEMVKMEITIPSRVVNAIKEDYRRVHSNGGSPACTTFEAVTALLWQCRTRAIIRASNRDDPVAIFFAVNARKFVRPGARDGYYGNCVTGLLVTATGDEVANGNLVDLVAMIQRGKSKIAEQFNKGSSSDDEQHVGSLTGYNLLAVTSWRNLGLEEVDFGGGRLARATSCSQQKVCVPPGVAHLPYRAIDGSNVMCACVTKDHAGAFLGELSSRFK